MSESNQIPKDWFVNMGDRHVSFNAGRATNCPIDMTRLVFGSFVYFLYLDQSIVYVGQSTKIGSRLNTHHMGEKKFDRVFAIEVQREDLDTVESAFIRLLRPRYNKATVTQRPTDKDREIAAKFGLEFKRKKMFKLKPYQSGAVGVVLILEGQYSGQLGWCDDFDWVHECDEWFDKNDVDPDALSEEQSEKICNEHGCSEMAIVYPGAWSEGYLLIEPERLAFIDGESIGQEELLEHLFPNPTEKDRLMAAALNIWV